MNKKFKDACYKVADNLDSKEFEEREDANRTNQGDFVPLLIEINELEMLTFNSQEGFYKEKNYSERAYVCSFMEISHAKDYCMNLNGKTDKVAFIVEDCKESKKHNDIPVSINLQMQNKISYPKEKISPSFKKDIQEQHKRNMQDFKKNKFVMYSRITTTMSKKYQEFSWVQETKLDKKYYENYCMVISFDPKWGRRSDKKGGLLYDILDTLEDIKK